MNKGKTETNEHKTEMNKEKTKTNKKITMTNKNKSKTNKSKQKEAQSTAASLPTMTREEQRMAMRPLIEQLLDGVQPSNSPSYLRQVAIQLQRQGWAEETAVQQIMSDSPFELKDEEVSAIVHGVYAGNEEVVMPPMNAVQAMERSQREFMKRRYELRANVVTGQTEYRERKRLHTSFRLVDQRVRNTMCSQAHDEGVKMRDSDMERLLDSDLVPLYDPFDEYLSSLPEWKGVNHIDKLFERVAGPDSRWTYFAHLWFLGMVALWRGMSKQHANELMLVIVGGQDSGKSTFCRTLLPPELQAYFTDDFSLDNRKEALRMVCRYGLINVDEMDRISERRQPMLKNLMQIVCPSMRKMHSDAIANARRYASFIGTSNQSDLLSDLTGSRRFVCIRLKDNIKTEPTIWYNQLYAQAVYELDHGARYWLTREEEAETAAMNSSFVILPPMFERVASCFTAADEDDPKAEWLTATEILSVASPRDAAQLTSASARKFRDIMENTLHVQCQRKRNGFNYLVKRIEEEPV